MVPKNSTTLNLAALIAVLISVSISVYAIWQVHKFEKKWQDLDNAIGIIQRRTDAIETHILNAEMTNFLNITCARLALNLNRQFIFYGLVDQAPLTHDVVISLYTRDDFFKSKDPELEKFIINLVKQHTHRVLETIKFTAGVTTAKINNVTINYLDNTNSKNLLAQYKNKKLKVKISNSFIPVSLAK